MTTAAPPPAIYTDFADPFYPGSLDSMEGVPDFAPAVAPARPNPAHAALNWLATMLPGVALAFLLAFLGYLASELLGHWMHYPSGKSPVSPITLAVLLGLAIRNTVGVPKPYEPGLRLCLKTVLRAGIVILGLTLSVSAIGNDVKRGIPIIIACITTALIFVTLINRALGLPRRLGTLIAVGTSICGISAIVATAPVIDAEDDETAYAVACITVFGLIALLAYPFLAHSLFPDHMKQAGIFLGTAIHDTSQVAGAGVAYAQQYHADDAMKTAITVKLVRNLSMSLLIPLMAILYRRGEQTTTGKKVNQPWHQIIPLFVIGFIAMACLRSLGDSTAGPTGQAFGLIPHAAWSHVDTLAKFYAPWLLATALGAVGLGTGLAKLKGLGLKPFSVGLAAALLVGGVSITLLKLLANFIQ